MLADVWEMYEYSFADISSLHKIFSHVTYLLQRTDDTPETNG